MAADFKRFLATLIFALAWSQTPIVPDAHSQTLQTLAAYRGEDRQQRLIDGAKKEGSLLFYTATPVEYANQLIAPFEKKYGIKVNLWRARGELILQRVINEAHAGKPASDVIASTSPTMEALRRENLLQEIVSSNHKELMPSAVPAHRQWVSTRQYVLVQAYNTNKVSKDELPKTYQDLLAPRWKGKLAIEGSDHEWLASVLRDMGEASGIKFFKDLVARNGLSVRNGHPLLTNLTASGEVLLALTVYQYSVQQAKKKGSPIEWFAIEPAIVIADGMAVSKSAPSPHAALLFYDYMISPEAQAILAKIGYYPTHTKIEPPIKSIKLRVLDPGTLLDEWEKSQLQFESILQTKR